MDLFLHRGADNPVSCQMVKDVLILSRDPKIEIGIDDSTDIENILYCKFNPLVDPVLDQARLPEFAQGRGKMFLYQRDSVGNLQDPDPDYPYPQFFLLHRIAACPV
jgi:hypothetical protein